MLALSRTSEADLARLSAALAKTGSLWHSNLVTRLAYDVHSSAAPPLRGWKLHLIEVRFTISPPILLSVCAPLTAAMLATASMHSPRFAPTTC
jgi:hypothetical protein